MESHNIRLSSTEVAGLWSTYIQDDLAICYLTYFEHQVKDKEILSLVKHSKKLSEQHLKNIKKILEDEEFPVPNGFSESDYDPEAPPLFYDLFALSFVYGMSKIGLSTYGNMTATVCRTDIVNFFGNAIVETKDLFAKSVDLMLNKGVYDRPPKIPYPKQVSFVSDLSYLGSMFKPKRPLNVAELTELFFHIERSYFASMLLSSFLQVVKDDKIKNYFIEGQKLAEKIILMCNELFHEDGLQGNVPLSMEVTDSNESPFSDRIMLYLINALNSNGINYFGHALSTSMRKDLSAKYIKLLPELLSYAEDGLNLLIKKNWFEEPPQAIDRREIINNKKTH